MRTATVTCQFLETGIKCVCVPNTRWISKYYNYSVNHIFEKSPNNFKLINMYIFVLKYIYKKYLKWNFFK